MGSSIIAKLENNKRISKELEDIPMCKIWQFLIHFEHTLGDNRKRVAQLVERETEDHVFHRLFEKFNSNLNQLRNVILSDNLYFDDINLNIEKAHWVQFNSKSDE